MSSTDPTKRVVVVIPTFNERDNLAVLVHAVVRHGFEVLIVDDNSPDGTGTEADRLASELSGVSVCHRPRREGLGPAYTEGFRLAMSAPVDVVCGMDADLSHDPAVLPRLVEPIVENRADMTIGSRYIEGGEIPHWSLFRRGLSHWGNIYARWALGIRVHDATSGYRAYRSQALERLGVASCQAVGYLFLTEISWRATSAGLRIEEVPITFRRRIHGESKMGGRIILEAMALVTVWGLRRLVGKSHGPETPGNIDLDRTRSPDS